MKANSNEKKYTLSQLRGAFGAGIYSSQGDPYSENPPIKIVDECPKCSIYNVETNRYFSIKTVQELQDINYIELNGITHHHINTYKCSKCGAELEFHNEKTNELENTVYAEFLRKQNEKHYLNVILGFINQKMSIDDIIKRDGKRGKNFTLFIQAQYPEIYHMWEIAI